MVNKEMRHTLKSYQAELAQVQIKTITQASTKIGSQFQCKKGGLYLTNYIIYALNRTHNHKRPGRKQGETRFLIIYSAEPAGNQAACPDIYTT